MAEFAHLPVMPAEVVDFLGCARAGAYVDGTVGGGGHASEILKANPGNRLIGLDRDSDALAAAQKALAPFTGRFVLVKENFRNVSAVLERLEEGPVDGMLLDLGVSSYQLESPERGFSFRFDSKLDMRMDRSSGLTARDLVNTLEEGELFRIFMEYGEEAHSRRIARAIVKARAAGTIETTGELQRIVVEAVPAKLRGGRIHPATRVFQALRIAVNDELGSLREGLATGMESLKPGGRMVVISFHSLEDRIVKAAFRKAATGCICPPKFPVCVCKRTPQARLVSKKAVAPSEEEVGGNPRARSAKLRAIEKL
ncbi:MAG: 16S rRNA (cytosine(1402)-N(4))-methyltransferase RsmH [Thermodesulfobacteriota bacterium]|nr:MAG: 16S rRNA (cytosine(1402)-N(4))-methyltransferase RsmH [Thermodesulfobacteriota bacterium]